MILIEGQKLYCKLCGKEVAKEDAIIIPYNIEANENEPLAIFNDAILDQECYNNNPLKDILIARIEEINKLEKNKIDYITGGVLGVENIGHPDNLVNVFYITEDKTNPLYRYNGISINKKNLSKWKDYNVFVKLITELDNSEHWKGNSIKNLIRHITSPVKEAYSEEFLKKMEERYGKNNRKE